MKIGLFLGILLGVLAGLALGGQPDVQRKVIHVKDTKTITKTVTKTVTKTELPDACAELIDTAYIIGKAGIQIDSTRNVLLGIMSDLRVALATGDGGKATELEELLRATEDDTLASIRIIGENRADYQANYETCTGKKFLR